MNPNDAMYEQPLQNFGGLNSLPELYPRPLYDSFFKKKTDFISNIK